MGRRLGTRSLLPPIPATPRVAAPRGEMDGRRGSKEVTALKEEAPHDPSVGCLACCTRAALARGPPRKALALGPRSWITGVAAKEAPIPGVQAHM
jgi:hypothetical protein